MASLKRTIRSLNALFIGMSFLFIGNSLIISSVGVILKSSGMDELIIGLISSCFFIGSLLATIMGHTIISRVGHVRSFGIFAALFAISSLFHALSENLYLWSIFRLFLGFSYYSLLVVIESWLNEKAKNEVRSRILGFYEIVYYVASGVGVLIIGLHLQKNDVFILSACLIMFSAIPLYLIRIKEPIIPQKEPISLPRIFDIAPLALVASFIAGMVVNGFFAMASVFILKQGFDPKDVSYFITSAMCGGFLAQSIIGTLSDKMGRKFAIMLCSAVSFVSMLIFFIFSLPLWTQCVLAVPLGGGIFCLYALSLARANDMSQRDISDVSNDSSKSLRIDSSVADSKDSKTLKVGSDKNVDKGKSVELGRGILFCYSFGSLFSPVILGFLMKHFDTHGFSFFYLISLGFCFVFAINKPNILRRSKKTPRNPGSTVMMK